jgi:AcrR family transcriptional regulator
MTVDNTYNKLIDTGIKLFGEHGYDTVSVRDIVNDSGVNLSAISYHFGGKAELYKAVVIYLVDEVEEVLNNLDANSFVTLDSKNMETRLREIIWAFHQMFLSRNGQSRLKIFVRETTSPDNNFSHQYFTNMVNNVRDFFYKILGAYYTSRDEPTDKIDFVICVLMNMLKNIPQQQNLPLRCPIDFDDVFERMINLILYSKI